MAFSRITDSMMNYGFLSSLQSSLNKQYKLQEQLADGKLVHRASDDPVRVIRSLQYRSAVVQNEQFKSNVQDAKSWMEITDSAVNDIGQIMARAKELVVRAIAPNPDIAYKAAAEELDGLINQAVSIGNTKIGDRYVFAGQMDKTQPFERLQLADPQGRSDLTIDTVVYYGDDRKISMITQPGEVNPARDGVNLTGIDVFGRTPPGGTDYGQATVDVFNKLIRIKEELEQTAMVSQTNVSGGKLTVDGKYDGDADFQDFAVKIDAVKVLAGTLGIVDSTAAAVTNRGTVRLAYEGDGPTLSSTIDQVRVITKTVGVLPGSITQTGAAVGEQSVELGLGAGGITAIRTRIDAVQASIGAVTKSNPLGGDMTIADNGYTGALPAPDRVEISVTANGAGQVTAATYRTRSAGTWSGPFTATVSAPGGTITLDDVGMNIGLVTQAATETENLTGNTYTFDMVTTGKVTKSSYWTYDGAAWTPALAANPISATADPTSDPSRFAIGATGYFVSMETNALNAYGGIYETAGGLASTGQIVQAQYQTHNAISGVWSAAADALPDNAVDPARFDFGATGFSASIGLNTNNQAGDQYTLGTLATNGEAASLSYSLDRGNTWVSATPPSISMTNSSGGQAVIGGSYTGQPTYENYAVRIDAVELTGTVTKPAAAAGDLHMAYEGALPVPATLDNIRIASTDSSGKVTAIEYSTDGGLTFSNATVDANVSGRFRLGGAATGMIVSIDQAAANAAGSVYNIVDSTISSTGRPAIVSHSFDDGGSFYEAAPVTTISQTNKDGAAMSVFGSFSYTGLPSSQSVSVKLEQVDDGKNVMKIRYSLDGQATWSDPVSASPSGSGKFSLGSTGLSVLIPADIQNAQNDEYSFSLSSASAPYATGIALADGVTFDIATNSANAPTDVYSFDGPPYFALGDSGIRVSVAPATANAAKDAYSFHMPQGDGGPDHTDYGMIVGPDLEWLSDFGISYIDTAHEQVLQAQAETGARLAVYEMTATMLDNSKISLTESLAANEDIDMAKAIIDLKTAENSYKASLSFGARILPTSLVDFLR